MSMTQYLLVFGMLLMLIDIFFASDIPTYISYILFTCAFSSILDVNVLVTIMLSIVFFFLLMVFHILIWRRTVSVLVNRGISKRCIYTWYRRIGRVEGDSKNGKRENTREYPWGSIPVR